MSKPLRRPGTRRCPACHEAKPLGWFSSHYTVGAEWRRVEHDVCKQCRAGSRGGCTRPGVDTGPNGVYWVEMNRLLIGGL